MPGIWEDAAMPYQITGERLTSLSVVTWKEPDR